MQAVILAGGKGTRLKPYTVAIPKPLVPIGDLPVLEIIIMQLKRHKIEDIIISTGHLAELIEAYFRKGNKWGVKIRYVREDKALGTAGAIKNIKGLANNFILMNGDTLTDLDYNELYNFHLKSNAAVTISAVKREVAIDFGVLQISSDSKLIKYTEKPKRYDYVSMGVNVLSKKCKKYILKGETIGIPELIWKMQAANENISCFKSDSYWLDIGRIEDFQTAQEEFEKNRERFL
ncbi:MAG: sugar phosphate nucleotidyltransferase [Candidatus Omnitrophota bacterium]